MHRIVLDLDTNSDPVSGRLTDGDRHEAFSGWIELTRLLDRAAREDAGVLIRDAVPDDAEEIAAIGRAGFPAVHRPALPEVIIEAAVAQLYERDALRECVGACAANPAREFLVAEADGEIVGFVHYEGDRDEPELMRIYLRQDRVGSGIGHRLVDELESRLGPGATYMLLVVGTNAHARGFYKRRGFVEESVVDGPPFFAVHMGIDLPPQDPVAAYVMRRSVPR